MFPPNKKAAGNSTIKKQSLKPTGEAERLVHEGIKQHEMGKLEQATELFKQASITELPIAMFLYGVSLRHGWVRFYKSSRMMSILTQWYMMLGM
jgi:hypothetical protein